MHIHIIPNRNSKPAVLLRESYRVGGNVRKRTLANLSKLPMDAVDAIKRILKGEKLVSLEDAFEIVENGSRLHGALLHGPEQIADLPVPVVESPGAVRIGHPERGHLLSISHPIRCSTRCLANVRVRISGPMIAL